MTTLDIHAIEDANVSRLVEDAITRVKGTSSHVSIINSIVSLNTATYEIIDDDSRKVYVVRIQFEGLGE